MRINNNLMAMNTHRQLSATQESSAKSMEKLSSGYRINRAGDDAAGLSISEKMRGQIRGLNQASRNAQDGISMIQTAEGALSETHAILQRMRELSVQAANDTNVTVDRDAIKEELTALKTEITRIGTSTEFNKQKLLDGTLGSSTTLHASLTVANGINAVSTNGTAAGTYTITAATNGGNLDLSITKGGVTETISNIAAPAAGNSSKIDFASFGISIDVNSAFTAAVQGNLDAKTITVAASGVDLQIGANNSSEQKLTVNIDNMKASALGVGGSSAHGTWSVNDVDSHVDTAGNAREVVDVLEKAISQVSTQRSKLGAYQNRLEHTIKNLDTSSENLQASESRIRDVDMAKEMMEFSKNNILQQAAQAMLAQANQAPQGVLQLLR